LKLSGEASGEREVLGRGFGKKEELNHPSRGVRGERREERNRICR